MDMTGVPGIYRVRIRRDRAHGAVRPEAEQLDGREFEFRPGWIITGEERAEYAGEMAMIADWRSTTHPYPEGAPIWIASGDLELVRERRYPHPPPGWKPAGDQPQQGDLITP